MNDDAIGQLKSLEREQAESMTTGVQLNYRLQLGDVFELKKGYGVYANPLRKDDRREIIVGGTLRIMNDHGGYAEESLDCYIGEYVVIGAKLTGGGPSYDGGYPDGWQITAKQLNVGEYEESGRKVIFYQSGCFTCTLPHIQPIGRMLKVGERFIGRNDAIDPRQPMTLLQVEDLLKATLHSQLPWPTVQRMLATLAEWLPVQRELNTERRKNLGLACDLKAALKQVRELEEKIQPSKVVEEINKNNSRRKPGWGTEE